jgi:hypothetical protein
MIQNDIQDYFFSEYSDFLEFLPLYFELSEEKEYIKNLVETFNLNYHYGKFESAFFNLHILYMIIIYSYILKLKNNNLEDFYLSLISLDKSEVKKYQGKFKNKKIKLFDFSMFKEKNVFSFFESSGFSEKDIKEISESVDKRNVYAHPRGRIIIRTSEELDELIQNNVSALERIHLKISPKVCNIFMSFMDENIYDFEDELKELDELNTKLEIEQVDEKLKLIKFDLYETNKLIEEKIRDFFIQENHLNKRDILDCLTIDIGDYSKLTRFDDKKKLFDKFKELFSYEE